MFGHLSPLEPRLGKKLVDPLTQIMATTPAKSLLFECIRTVTKGLNNHTSLVKLAVEKLRDFVEEPDPNLKFLGLRALQDLLQTHPRAVAEHKKTIFRCLQVKRYTNHHPFYTLSIPRKMLAHSKGEPTLEEGSG
jgi:AP-3 complex subunit delta-1